MRIGFFGTPNLSSSVLEDILVASDIEVCFVVTNPDKSVGRSGELQPTPVKSLALIHDIPVFTPTKIRENQDFFEELRRFDCDYFVVVAYGRILPTEILQIPKKKCINIHGSILPLYRGASPIQSVLLDGKKETGVTIMEMSEGMDEGDILKIHTILIDPMETSESLFQKFSDISGTILIQALRELETGGITQLPQDSTLATYCKKIEKEDGLIDWNNKAEKIYHMWQAYTPWPGIYTMYEGKRLLLEKVSVFYNQEEGVLKGREEVLLEGKIQAQENGDTGFFLPQYDGKIGTVIQFENGKIGIICGDGILTLNQVKLEGKKSQNIRDFVNGNQKFIGITL